MNPAFENRQEAEDLLQEDNTDDELESENEEFDEEAIIKHCIFNINI